MTNHRSASNQILLISSYPPRECGIATYCQDLIRSLQGHISPSIKLQVCALNNGSPLANYPEEVIYQLDSNQLDEYIWLGKEINQNDDIGMVFIQHEFGLFAGDYGEALMGLLYTLHKPVLITLHTVLPSPGNGHKHIIQSMANIAEALIVMTHSARRILIDEYLIDQEKVHVIPHGTHAVETKDVPALKRKYGLEGKKVVTTFGFIGANKNIETALAALPAVVAQFKNVVYLVIGKTHPEIIKQEGEMYREQLSVQVSKLKINEHVHFINKYIALNELLDLLQMTDIYLFMSKDRHQAVSGTFAYAMSCGCPIIATGIPHAKEMLTDQTGILVDFENPEQTSQALIQLLSDEKRCTSMSLNATQSSKTSEWKNVAAKHTRLFQSILPHTSITLNLPEISLKHIKRLTKGDGIIQFANVAEPDTTSGYTLDDNARALVALCMHLKETNDSRDLLLIEKYLDFVCACQRPDGLFFNYMNINRTESEQNETVNLEDSNGRAIWALGTLLAHAQILPYRFIIKAQLSLGAALQEIQQFESPRAIAFCIKGLYLYNSTCTQTDVEHIIHKLSTRLAQKYLDTSKDGWHWFENYLTYSNSVLPEAMLYAYLSNKEGDVVFKNIAKESFDFLLEQIFTDTRIKVISNNGWMHKGSQRDRHGGEQPVDVAYTIESLYQFHQEFPADYYGEKMEIAFSWFLGNNELCQLMYNPTTGGCHDGMEKENINLNQGAESTICYLMARLTMDRAREKNKPTDHPLHASPMKILANTWNNK